MTINEFLAALGLLTETGWSWYETDGGELRGTRNEGDILIEASPLTALAMHTTGQVYSFYTEWDSAAEVLGLSLEDASAVVSAEDQDRHHNFILAQGLRTILGVASRPAPQHAQEGQR
jgi:hypothetical protein